MHTYVYNLCIYDIHINADICLCISEMNDNNDTKDRKKELGLFYYYKVLYSHYP